MPPSEAAAHQRCPSNVDNIRACQPTFLDALAPPAPPISSPTFTYPPHAPSTGKTCNLSCISLSTHCPLDMLCTVVTEDWRWMLDQLDDDHGLEEFDTEIPELYNSEALALRILVWHETSDTRSRTSGPHSEQRRRWHMRAMGTVGKPRRELEPRRTFPCGRAGEGQTRRPGPSMGERPNVRASSVTRDTRSGMSKSSSLLKHVQFPTDLTPKARGDRPGRGEDCLTGWWRIAGSSESVDDKPVQ
ncbi:hypothetical protein BJY52DRAFT_1422109 [Lactarius psammicola]|nr:hypothetical protein BJY52DRAFT_1422109 [Lactarius psammicola]